MARRAELGLDLPPSLPSRPRNAYGPASSTAMRLEHRDPDTHYARDVAARGARIRFIEAGDGLPLILVHDYLASHVAWDDVLPQLSRKFHVIAPDLPGFGESEKPSPSRYAYDFDAFAESLIDLVAALGLARVSVCGHALGGAIALTIAASHPDVVEKLVLVNPLVYPPPEPDMMSRVASIPLLGPFVFKQLYGRALFRTRFLGYANQRASGRTTQRVDQLFELFDIPAAREAAYATMMHAMLDTRSLIARVPRVTAPTLITWGRRHRASPVEHGRRLARELREARFEVFDCGASPPEECPTEFVSTVSSFISDGERR